MTARGPWFDARGADVSEVCADPTGRSPVAFTKSEASGQRRCEQCGRYGVRGFEELRVSYGGVDYGVIVQCANRRACARRYERQRPVFADE